MLGAAAQAQNFTPDVTGAGGASQRETRAYMGLAWQFGTQPITSPKIVAGVQALDVGPDDKVRGVDLNVWFDLDTGPARIALSAIGGDRSALANLGVGYDFGSRQAIITAGLQAAHLRGGIDFALRSRDFVPYFEVNSLRRPAAVSGAQILTCSEPGYVLVTRDQVDAGGLLLFDFIESNGLDIDGRACMNEGFVV